DAAARGVDGEQETTVVADLDPAWRRLQVGEGRGADRCQRAVAGHAEPRDASRSGSAVGVGDEQLARVGGPELAAERPRPLRREGRAGCGCEVSIGADSEAVDQRRVYAYADQVGPAAVKQ